MALRRRSSFAIVLVTPRRAPLMKTFTVSPFLGPTEAPCCAQSLIPSDRPSGVRLVRLSVFPGRDDYGSAAGCDRIMALAGVEGTVGGDAGDFLIGCPDAGQERFERCSTLQEHDDC